MKDPESLVQSKSEVVEKLPGLPYGGKLAG